MFPFGGASMNRRKDSKRDAGMIQLRVRPTRQKVTYINIPPPGLASALTNWAGFFCIKCLLTNLKECGIIGRASTTKTPEIFIISYSWHFVKQNFAQIYTNILSRICAIFHLVFCFWMWYYNGVKGRDPVEPPQGGYPVG